jgi:hypothetical protein
MLADGLAFSIRVSSEIYRVRFLRSLLQFCNDLFIISLASVGDNFVSGLEIMLDINTQRFRGQIFNVAYRGFNQIVLPQVFIDCFRLGGRFDTNP